MLKQVGFGHHRSFRKLKTLPKCPRWSFEKETLLHALKDCPTERTILFIGYLDNRLLVKKYDRCIDWLEDAMRVLDKKAAANFIIVLWNNWNNQNNFILKGKEDAAQAVWDKAKSLRHDFRIYNLVHDLIIHATPICERWEKPMKGYTK
ncbi:hypothetical protein Goarm_006495, partial [Gossypium armourianum]|nr:hypothetical protein [Gossypium armourianum]